MKAQSLYSLLASLEVRLETQQSIRRYRNNLYGQMIEYLYHRVSPKKWIKYIYSKIHLMCYNTYLLVVLHTYLLSYNTFNCPEIRRIESQIFYLYPQTVPSSFGNIWVQCLLVVRPQVRSLLLILSCLHLYLSFYFHFALNTICILHLVKSMNIYCLVCYLEAAFLFWIRN